MRQLWKYILLFVLVTGFSNHLLAVSRCQTIPPQPQTEEYTISMPVEAVVVMEQTEISSLPAPTSVIHRSRRTISQLTNPTPITYAQYVYFSFAKDLQEKAYRTERIIINLPSEQISFPFHSFW